MIILLKQRRLSEIFTLQKIHFLSNMILQIILLLTILVSIILFEMKIILLSVSSFQFFLIIIILLILASLHTTNKRMGMYFLYQEKRSDQYDYPGFTNHIVRISQNRILVKELKDNRPLLQISMRDVVYYSLKNKLKLNMIPFQRHILTYHLLIRTETKQISLYVYLSKKQKERILNTFYDNSSKLIV